MFGLAWLLWLHWLNKQKMYAAREDREMSREINEAHSTEVTLQKQNVTRESESQTPRSTAALIYFFFLQIYTVIDTRFKVCCKIVQEQQLWGCSLCTSELIYDYNVLEEAMMQQVSTLWKFLNGIQFILKSKSMFVHNFLIIFSRHSWGLKITRMGWKTWPLTPHIQSFHPLG